MARVIIIRIHVVVKLKGSRPYARFNNSYLEHQEQEAQQEIFQDMKQTRLTLHFALDSEKSQSKHRKYMKK